MIYLSGTTFSKMGNLKIFIHRAGCYSGVLDYLPNSLRVIDWPDCPFQSFPSNFNARKLAVFKMPGSRITGLLEGFKNLTNLRYINVSYCQHLTKVPDLSEVPNLKRLILAGCENLIEVHPSVGLLDKLEELYLLGSSNLTIFPTRVSWKSMTELEVACCYRLENFIEIVDRIHEMDSVWNTLSLNKTPIKQLPSWIGYLTSLTKLQVSGTPIKTLPSSIGNLSRLQNLQLVGCENLTEVPHGIYGLQHLLELHLSWCTELVNFPNKANSEVPSLPLFPSLQNLQFEGCRLISITDFLDCLDCISTLEELNLSESDLSSLPACITKFVGLRRLRLHGCKSLRNISELPQDLELIDVGDCISLEKFPAFSKILEVSDKGRIKHMELSNCHRLQLVDNLCFGLVSIVEDASVPNQIVSKIANVLATRSQVDKESEFEVILPGSEVPNWFRSQKVDVCVLMRIDFENDIDTEYDICELLIEFPRTLKWEETGLVVCAVLEATEDYDDSDYDFEYGFGFCLRITINEVPMDDCEVDIDDRHGCFLEETETETSAHVWLKYIPLKVDIKEEVDRKSDPQMPYLCRLKFVNIAGENYIFKSCGVHFANVPCDHDDNDHYDYDSTDDEGERDEDDASSRDPGGEFDKAEAATVSTALVLSGGTGISTQGGVEHCDHDEEPGPTKKCEQNHSCSHPIIRFIFRSGTCCAVM